MRSKIYLIYTFVLIIFSFVLFFNGILRWRKKVIYHENIGLMCPYIRFPRGSSRELEFVPQNSPAGRTDLVKGDMLISVAGIQCNAKNKDKIQSIINRFKGKFALGKYIPIKVKRGNYILERKLYLTEWKSWKEVFNLSSITSILAFLTGFILFYFFLKGIPKLTNKKT